MAGILSRAYCLTHPWEIGRLYGWNVVLETLVSKRSPLDRVARSLAATRGPMPRPLGMSYRIATLLELRAEQIYRRMAERFESVPLARALFEDLADEEQEHARLMTICLHTVRLGPSVKYVPSVMAGEIRRAMNEMRALQRRIPTMTLEEALEASKALERSEINVIFGKLFDQVAEPEVLPLREAMRQAENHAATVPKRIAMLREQLSKLGATTGSTRSA